MELKICSTCETEKPVSEFDKKIDRPGYSHWCKACRRAYTNIYIKQSHVKEQRINYAKERRKDPRVKAMLVKNVQKSRRKRQDADPKKYKLLEMLVNARKRAKQREYEGIMLTEDDFPNYQDIEYCPILGIKLCWVNKNKLQANSPTIDRIDSTRGYTRDNVVIISHRANTLKNDGTADEHQAIADFMRSKTK